MAEATKDAGTAGTLADNEAGSDDNHDSLKYHLLGPSLTKSGQDGVDQRKVSEIIYNASKGSKYFNNEQVKDKNLTTKINRILEKKSHLDNIDMSHDLRVADNYIAELELSRDLSQTVVHVDCDMFYAAVEELDRPELKNLPFGVGIGVLTTCNYVARQYGVRSAMAGFVAKKICPDLICLPLNFDKYLAKAKEVRSILAEYDPKFESASIDEAYLNISEYCASKCRDAGSVVSEMRARVQENCHITISAGLAPNASLAKIASNMNKPNGQYRVLPDRSKIMEFMRVLPTRKVNGIGRVFERELAALGVTYVGEIYAYRAFLQQLFGQKAMQFLLRVYLGLGKTDIRPAEEHERKSVGTESTFSEISSPEELRNRLRRIADELEGDLARNKVKGRTLCLKIKLHTYEVMTRQVVPPKAVHKADDLYQYALPMLEKLEKEFSPNLKLRLMGLRCVRLVSTDKSRTDFFGGGSGFKGETFDVPPKTHEYCGLDDDGWQVWPDTEFEVAAERERQDELKELAILSQELEEALPEQKPPQVNEPKKRLSAEPVVWTCPICAMPQSADDNLFNKHIDFCLSKSTIKAAVQEFSTFNTITEPDTVPSHAGAKKRERPINPFQQASASKAKRTKFGSYVPS